MSLAEKTKPLLAMLQVFCVELGYLSFTFCSSGVRGKPTTKSRPLQLLCERNAGFRDENIYRFLIINCFLAVDVCQVRGTEWCAVHRGQ